MRVAIAAVIRAIATCPPVLSRRRRHLRQVIVIAAQHRLRLDRIETF